MPNAGRLSTCPQLNEIVSGWGRFALPLSDHGESLDRVLCGYGLGVAVIARGCASTRTTMEVRTNQGRGTHKVQFVQGCLVAQQLPDPLLCRGEC